MKKFGALTMVMAGIVLIVGSVGYGVIFVGIPGPDDSPAELARQSLLGKFVIGGSILGASCLVAGVTVGISQWLSRKRRLNLLP